MADHINQVDNIIRGRSVAAVSMAGVGMEPSCRRQRVARLQGGCGQPGRGEQPSGRPQPVGGAQPGGGGQPGGGAQPVDGAQPAGGGQPVKRRATSGGRRGHPARI